MDRGYVKREEREYNGVVKLPPRTHEERKAPMVLNSLKEKVQEQQKLLDEQEAINEQLELDLVHKKEEVLKLTSELNDLRQGRPIPPYMNLRRKDMTPIECELEYYKKELRKQDEKIRHLKDFEYKSIMLKRKLSAKQEKIDDLTKKLSYVRYRAGSMEEEVEVERREKEMAELKAKCAEAEQAVKSLKEELDAKNAQVMNLLEMIDDAEDRASRTSRRKDEEIKKLENQLTRVDRYGPPLNDTVCNQWQCARDRRNAKRDDVKLQAQKGLNDQLKKQLALSNEVAKAKVEELEAQLKAKTSDFALLLERNEKLDTSFYTMLNDRAEKKMANAKVEELEAQLRAKNLEIEQLKTQQSPDVAAILKASMAAVMENSRAQMKDMEDRHQMEMDYLETKNQKEFARIHKDLEALKISAPEDWRRAPSKNQGPYVPPHLRYQKAPLVRGPCRRQNQKFPEDEVLEDLETDVMTFMDQLSKDSQIVADIEMLMNAGTSKAQESGSEDSDSESNKGVLKANSSKSSFSDLSFSSEEGWVKAQGGSPDRASPNY